MLLSLFALFMHLIQSDPTSCPINQREITKYINDKCCCQFLPFLCTRGFGPPERGIERSGCPYVRLCVRPYARPSVDQVKIFVKGRMLRPITCNGSKLIFNMRLYQWDQQEYTTAMTSWPIFQGPLTSDFGLMSVMDLYLWSGDFVFLVDIRVGGILPRL